MVQTNEVQAFKDWLERHGGVLKPTTNPYEVVRFVAKGKTSIIYIDKHKCISSFTGEAEEAWYAWKNKANWDGENKTPRNAASKRKANLRKELLARDGQTCTYCGSLMEEATLEHFIPLSRGGEDGLNNMVMACSQCNKEVGDMNIRQKIEYAITKRKCHGV